MTTQHLKQSESDLASMKAISEQTVAGQMNSYVGAINNVDIPPEQMTQPKWSLTGSVFPYSAINYTPQQGAATSADMNSYPLSTCLLPAVPSNMTQPFALSLTGYYTGNPPGPFAAQGESTLLLPGVCGPLVTTYYGSIVDVVDINGQPNVGLCSPGDVSDGGIFVVSPFISRIGRGRIYCVNLVNDLAYRITQSGEQIYIANSYDTYLYDGSNYPYEDIVQIDEAEHLFNLEFYDEPSLILEDDYETDQYIYVNMQFKTYFFYDDETGGIPPVMIRFPIQWGFDATVKYSDGWVVNNYSVTPLANLASMLMPEWTDNYPGMFRQERKERKKWSLV